jgi:hypothetical protein
MRTQYLPLPRFALAALAVVALVGCASVSGDKTAGSAGAAKTPVAAGGAGAPLELHNGMNPGEVRQALGNPELVQQMGAAKGNAEKWIYTRGRKTEVRQVVAGTKDVPYFDPMLNEMRMIPEPVYADEATTITEELHLFWREGELVEWKTTYRSDRSYTRL